VRFLGSTGITGEQKEACAWRKEIMAFIYSGKTVFSTLKIIS